MRTKCIAVLIAFCTLIALASAQIDNCCFVDRQCSSDQEWSDGYWAFQNGQCVAPAPSANLSVPVDNCCGIDRQCSTDAEWLSGWQAYQNNQCAAPAPPQPQTSTAPVGNAPANVDNCCFVDRQCNTDLDWEVGYYDFRDRQCAAPAQSVVPVLATGGNCCSLGWQCRSEVEREYGYWAYQINQCAGLPQTSAVTLTGPVPRIEGSSRFVSHITATLKFMKSVAPDWYNYVITGMDSIVEVPVPGWKFGDACTARAYDRERKVTLESCWIDYDSGVLGFPEVDQRDTAAALGHEACHIHTHEEGKHFATQEDEEAECRKFATGPGALLSSALATGLDPSRGTHYFDKVRTLGLLRQYCSEGYRADLFCPTLQRLEDLWRNVPHTVFPPGAPEW